MRCKTKSSATTGSTHRWPACRTFPPRCPPFGRPDGRINPETIVEDAAMEGITVTDTNAPGTNTGTNTGSNTGSNTGAVPHDDDPRLFEYAHPERLVTTDWLSKYLDDPRVVVVESDEDVLLYDAGHIPGAVEVYWPSEPNDREVRGARDGRGFGAR